MRIGDNMKKLLIFQEPAIAQKLRAAGFSVFRQKYGCKECFAVEDSEALQDSLRTMTETFGEVRFASSNTLCF